MQIRYTHSIAVDLGGAAGHTEAGQVKEVPEYQGNRLIALGHAEAVDPIAEPVRAAEPPKRRTR